MKRRLFHTFRRDAGAFRQLARVVLVALLLSALALSSLGCCARLRDRQARRLLRQKETPVQEETFYASTELVLNVDDVVENITLSPDSKRLILETSLDSVDAQPLVLAEPKAAQIGVEVWNIEFADARPEAISSQTPYLVASASGCAAFDEQGERLFWLGADASGVLAQTDLAPDAVVRGASVDPLDGPIVYATPNRLYASPPPAPSPTPGPDDDIVAFPDVDAALTGEPELAAASNLDSVVDSALEGEATTPEAPDEGEGEGDDAERLALAERPPRRRLRNGPANVLFVKKLSDDLFSVNRESETTKTKDGVQRVKIAEEVKDASFARLSPQAKWLICYSPTPEYLFAPLAEETPKADSESEAPANEGDDAKTAEKPAAKAPVVEEPRPYDENWSIALLRDRKRVARFPDKVKMTFDSSTSDEEVFGRVVDVLDVADSEDLVATLVEEIMPDDPAEKATSGDFNLNPRYKIVVWDLNVPRTVDLEKAKFPLFALEVSQIAIPYPIERKFCKFSPSGKAFAARVEPKYVTIWQSVSGRRVAELGEHEGVVRNFAFAPGETKMVVGTEGEVARLQLWEIRKGVVYRTLDDYAENAKSVQAIAISKDEKHVYFANDLGQIKRWDLRPNAAREYATE